MHPSRQPDDSRSWARAHPVATALGVAGAALAAAALVNARAARNAEDRNPPHGRFISVGGLELHHVDRGAGPALVLLHGNGSMIQDFETSGLIDLAASQYRVIAFDRPGYGHSSRPRGRLWTAGRQADLIHEALRRMGIERPIILGHSWGALVAVAYGLRHPTSLAGLVLASGYYFPTARVDAAVMAGPAVPVLGDVIRHTVSPLLGRLIWPKLIGKMFAPQPVSRRFAAGFPAEMALRPSQIRASAAEAGMMIPTAESTCNSYPALQMPVSIIAGEGDRIVDIEAQSRRLHRDIPHSSFQSVAGAGHMVHHADPGAVLRAIDAAAGSAVNGNKHAEAPLRRASRIG